MTRRLITFFALLTIFLFTGGARRRSSLQPGCFVPALEITSSVPNACATDPVLIRWRATDPAATVSIPGIGSRLASTGSVVVSSGVRYFAGRATNSCATGPETVLIITEPTPPSGSISGASSMSQGTTSSFVVSIADASSWTLTSVAGNRVSPSAGTGSATVSYTATVAGMDTLALTLVGRCSSSFRRVDVDVRGTTPTPQPPTPQPPTPTPQPPTPQPPSPQPPTPQPPTPTPQPPTPTPQPPTPTPQPPTPTPQPPTGGLLCCDGTRSPSCFSCSSKSGCCSGHGGVCGCPKSDGGPQT